MAVSTGPSSLAAPFDLADEYYNHHGSALTNGANITATLTALAGRTGASGTLHVQVPSEAWTLYCDPINFGSYSITKFGFLENTSPLTIYQTGTGWTLWTFGTLYEIVIGSQTAKADRDDYNLTLRGTWTTSNTGADGDGNLSQVGMVSISPGSSAVATGPIVFRCHFDRPKSQGVRWWGNGTPGSQIVPNTTIYVAGRWKNGGCALGYLRGDIVYDLEVSDPYGRGRGWDGSAGGAVSRTTAQYRACFVDFTKTIGNQSGRIDLKYGDCQWFGGFEDDNAKPQTFGSADAPLIIASTDYGWSGPAAQTDLGWPAGTKLGTAWYYAFAAFKFDGLSKETTGYGERFVKLIEIDGYGPQNCTSNANQYAFIEAENSDEGGTIGREVGYVTFTLVNTTGKIFGRAAGGGTYADAIHHLTYRGDGINPAQVGPALSGSSAQPYINCKVHLSIGDTLEYASVYNVDIDLGGATDERLYQRGQNNTLQNVTIQGGGKLTVIAGADAGNTATNIRFGGVSAREVIEVQAGGQLDITNIYAPAGSTIDVQSGATVRVWNGSGWTTLGAGSHTISPANMYVTDAGAIPADIPLTGAEALPIGKPASDVSSTGWLTVPSGSAVYEVLNEDSVDSADYAFTTQSGQTFEVALNAVSDPLSATGHVVLWSGKGSYTLSLRQGTSTEIASWTKDDASEQLYAEPLTEAQANSITDYSDLRIRVVSGS